MRNWLRGYTRTAIPGGSLMGRRFQLFESTLPAICAKLSLNRRELTFSDLALCVATWLKENPRPTPMD
ncbi:MAG: hypothetical protein U0575_13330 [Phycisphaerales bacterium]